MLAFQTSRATGAGNTAVSYRYFSSLEQLCVLCVSGRGKGGRNERSRAVELDHREEGKGEYWESSVVSCVATIGVLLWHWAIVHQQHLVWLFQKQHCWTMGCCLMSFCLTSREHKYLHFGGSWCWIAANLFKYRDKTNKLIYFFFSPSWVFLVILHSCYTAVKSNNIGVIFYSELSSEFVLLIFLAVKSSIRTCPRYNGASNNFFSFDRCIPAPLLFTYSVVRICVGFCLKQHASCSHLFSFMFP